MTMTGRALSALRNPRRSEMNMDRREAIKRVAGAAVAASIPAAALSAAPMDSGNSGIALIARHSSLGIGVVDLVILSDDRGSVDLAFECLMCKARSLESTYLGSLPASLTANTRHVERTGNGWRMEVSVSKYQADSLAGVTNALNQHGCGGQSVSFGISDSKIRQRMAMARMPVSRIRQRTAA